MHEFHTPRFRLFLMMFLELAILGAWFPLIFSYLPSLGFSATMPPKVIAPFVPAFLTGLFSEQGMILNAFPLAAIVGLFFSNEFADRNFAAEKVLAFSSLVGGLAILGCGFVREFWPFFWLMLIHCLLYVPTISITSSIAFANIKDAQQEFGPIRMGATIGWIAVAWPFTFILVDWAAVNAGHPRGLLAWLGLVFTSGLQGAALQDAMRWIYIVSGIASLTLAVYSLTLPHTPPKKKSEGGAENLAWLEAIRLLKRPFVFVLWIVTFIDSCVLNTYFNWTGTFLGTPRARGGVGIPGNWIMPVMSIGQVAEILTMLVLGVTLKKLGWRMTMAIGTLGHVVRFAVYAFFPQTPALIIAVQILHGICYAFFFATVYIFVDAYFPKDVRSSAQGLFNVMVLGVGVLVTNSICPRLIQETYTRNGLTDFTHLFLLPCYAGLVAMLLLLFAFHPPKTVETTAGSAAPPGCPD